jgi:DNA-directed RNA polymerase subunit RPC12/RpoP
MADIRCPACGDTDPVRDDDIPHTPGTIPLKCTKCDQTWSRQPSVVCPRCSSRDVDVAEYEGWSFDDHEEAREDPASAAWSYLDRSVIRCRACRHRWSRVEHVRPHQQRA